jgi:galactose mutarotase-like enzyme
MSVVLRAGDLAATFEPDAGLVCASLSAGGDELLGQRGGLDAYVRDRKTFGIPLLHPWANRLGGWSYGEVEIPRDSPAIKAEEHGLPIHGVLHGTAAWTVASATGDRLHAVLDFGEPAWLAAFPFPHRLEVEALLAPDGLQIATTLTATGDVAVPVSFGWHPYLQLPGVEPADWRIATSVRRRLVLDARGIPVGATEDAPVADGPLGGRAFDDLYGDAEGAWLTVEGGGRRIEVRFLEGYTHAQLFADPGKGLMAFEPMTAPVDALVSGTGLRRVQPGASFRAAFRVATR